MAKIRKRKLTWKASASSRVTGYKVYWSTGGRLDYHAPCVDVGNVTAIIVPDDLTGLPAQSQKLTFGVTAVDSEGNESEMVTIDGAGLFRAPVGPSSVRIETHLDPSPADGALANVRNSANAGGKSPYSGTIEVRAESSMPADPRNHHRVEETREALTKIDKLLSRFFHEE